MTKKEIKETLEKQLQLLSERSNGIASVSAEELLALTQAMVLVAKELRCC